MNDKIVQRENQIQATAVKPTPEKEIQTKEYVPAGPVHLAAPRGKIRLVILESPLAPKNGRTQEENTEYARKCVRDSLHRGEAPLASHLLYAQPGVLADTVPEERKLGMEAGLAWGRVADMTVVYTDYGISDGMKTGIERAAREGRQVEFRKFDGGDVAKVTKVVTR